MSEKLKPRYEAPVGKAEQLVGAAAAAYVVGKTVHQVHTRRKAEKAEAERQRAAESKAAAETSRQAEESARAEDAAQEPTGEEQTAFNRQKSRLSELKTYMNQHINAPASLRKLLPRDRVYHSPWAYHKAPSYASLHLNQSEYNTTPESRRNYNSGMEQLAADGKKPLHDALAKGRQEDPDSPWGTVLGGSDFAGIPEHVKDAKSAIQERKRIVGLLEAVEGMGFDSSDMAFARWEDRQEDARYAVVPYDIHNDLHHTAAEGLGEGMELAEEPGFMIRYQGAGPDESSVSMRAVDIASLRSEMGSDTIPPTPAPRELAHGEYRSPPVLPSTPVGLTS